LGLSWAVRGGGTDTVYFLPSEVPEKKIYKNSLRVANLYFVTETFVSDEAATTLFTIFEILTPVTVPMNVF